MAVQMMERFIVLTLIAATVNKVEGSSTKSSASYHGADSRVLKDEWKQIEASHNHGDETTAPLKKTLNVYRSLLTSLDEYRDQGKSNTYSSPQKKASFSEENDRSSQQQGDSSSGDRSDDSIKNNKAPMEREEDNIPKWNPGWTRGKPFNGEDVNAWTSAWEVSESVADFASFTRPEPVVVPVRVDLVMVGFDGEGNGGVDISDTAKHAWFGALPSTIPISSGHEDDSFRDSPPVLYQYEFRLVKVSPRVCAAVEKILQRLLIRSEPLLTNSLNASDSDVESIINDGISYVPGWRMEMILDDMVSYYNRKNNKDRFEWSAKLDEMRYESMGGDLEEEAKYHARYGNDGGDDWQPALSLFLLNPRKTFVSNYQKESYGYRSGFGLSELNSLIRHNDGVLEEAIEDEDSEQIFWRKQTNHHQTHKDKDKKKLSSLKNFREELFDRTINMKRDDKGGLKNGEWFDEGNDGELLEYDFWRKKFNAEFELQEDEITLRSVSKQFGKLLNDKNSDDTDVDDGDGGGKGTSHGSWSGRLYEIDMSDYTSEWASQTELALLEDQHWFELEVEGNMEQENSARRIQVEFEDASKGTSIYWKSNKFRDRVNINYQTNQISMLPFESVAGTNNNDSVQWKRFLKKQSEVIKSNGQKRYRSISRDLLKFARLQAQHVDVSGLEPCVTDIWMMNAPLNTDNYEQNSRISWIDLSAGPFTWGPIAGGKSVRTPYSLPIIDEKVRQDIQAFQFKQHAVHSNQEVLHKLVREKTGDGSSSQSSEEETNDNTLYEQDREILLEIGFLESALSKRNSRLSSMSNHLGCDHIKAATAATSASTSIPRSARNRRNAMKREVEDYNETKQCSFLRPQVLLLMDFTLSQEKLKKYANDFKTPKQKSVFQSLSIGYLELLRTVYQLLDPLASPYHVTALTSNAAAIISPAEVKIISQLSSVVHDISTHLLTPILSVPTLKKAAKEISDISLNWDTSKHDNRVGVNKKETSNALSNWWAFQHRYSASIIVDLFVVLTHNTYDPLDVPSGGFDVSEFQDAVFSLTAPLNQALSFTIHMVKAWEEPLMTLAMANATTTVTRPWLDKTGKFTLKTTQCIDPTILRNSLRNSQEQIPNDGSRHIPVFLLSFEEETMIGCDHVLANLINPDIPTQNKQHPFGDYLVGRNMLNDERLLPHMKPPRLSEFNQPEFLPSKEQKNGILDLDGSVAVAVGNELGFDTVIAVQSPSTHNEVSGYSCGTATSSSISSDRQTGRQTRATKQSQQRNVAVSMRNPGRALTASTISVLGLISQSVTKSYPKPKPPSSWSSDVLSTSASDADDSSYEHLNQEGNNNQASSGSHMIQKFGKKSIDDNQWLLANSDMPTSPFSRHPIVGALVSDAAARSNIAMSIAAAVEMCRYSHEILMRIPSANEGIPLQKEILKELSDVFLYCQHVRRRANVVAQYSAHLNFKTAATHLSVILEDARKALVSAQSLETITKTAYRSQLLQIPSLLLSKKSATSPSSGYGVFFSFLHYSWQLMKYLILVLLTFTLILFGYFYFVTLLRKSSSSSNGSSSSTMRPITQNKNLVLMFVDWCKQTLSHLVNGSKANKTKDH